MDWRSLIGVAVGGGAIAFAYGVDGGELAALLQPSGLAVVLGGTLGALLLQCGPLRIVHAARLLSHSFSVRHDRPDLRALVRLWGATVRRSGALALDGIEKKIDDPFIARGLRLLVDGVTPTRIAEILDADTDAFEMQRRQAIRVWESAGGTAPTMGILGAVLGLVQVMQHLSEPAKLGPGIAVAFVSTLYGVGLANLLFLPVANRMKEQLATELRERDLFAGAIVAIASGEPGHLIEERVGVAPARGRKEAADATLAR